ncbi:family 43 glycosylhydrolase [Aquipuribacter hungaricus]|uniref:Family 43 glycosylhydrolase n=2 Tax=Aquipuribacter hungaricus TaxID=545624 RepID=A0ABV7WHK3_9MICO
MTPPSRARRATIALAAVGALVLGTVTTTAAQAAPPGEGLVAEYLFDETAGATVPNTAPGSALGAATVRNVQAADWTGTSLRLRGGAKTSTGNWVELPDDLLAGERSATVTAEVKASAAMLNGFHFLWNVGNESPDTQYFFTSLNCGSGRAPLVGVKSAGVERLVQASGCGVTADQWVNVTAVVDGAAGTAALYLDGARVAQGPVDRTPADVVDQSLNTIGRAPWPDPLFQGAVSAFRVYDRALSAQEVADVSASDVQINAAELRARADAVLAGLALTDRTTSGDIDLPTAGGRVTWTSSDPAVVAPDGAVTAPLAGQPSVQVQLTATVSVRGITATRTITVTVEASTETSEQRVQRLAERLVVPPVVSSGTALPGAPEGTTVAVESVTGAELVDGALVTSATTATEAQVALRVTDQVTGASTVRTFVVRVLPAGASTDVLAYSRTPTTATEANNADVALSMHLALREDGAWSPLNEGYGIWFAQTSVTPPVAGTSSGIIRSLRDPHAFYLADGTFGVVATRTVRDGGRDAVQASSMLLARSTDLRTYDEVGLVDLGVTSGVNQPAVVFDTAAQRYVVSWTSDAGAALYTSFADLTDPDTRGPVRRGTVAATAGAPGEGVPSYATGNSLPVTTEVARALEVRFGRTVNTSVEAFEDVTVEQGGQLSVEDLPARVELGYDDGSTASRAVAWDEDSLAAVDTTTPGTYEVTGQVKAPAYVTPFADERADPSIFRHEWNGQTKFYLIATEDLNLNPVDPANGPHMPFRVADRIEDLSDEALRDGRNVEVDLLRAGDTDAAGREMTGCFWAPELHVIEGTLSILFMPCYDAANGRPDAFTGRASIIQLKKDASGADLDPAVAANWTKAEPVLRQDGSILNPVQNISLDMTYVVDGDQSYYAWQQLGAIFVARMDPSDPTRLTSPPVRVYAPLFAWDNTIAEGPNVHVRDGVLYMLYSGSLVGDTYTTGLLTAQTGTDLTDPAAWTPLDHPVQKSGIYDGEWQLGTGHGMWSYDEDDNLLYVFHARTDNLGLSGRDTFVRRVHFAADGLPVLDMQPDEEVAPENRTVRVTVTVTAAPVEELDVTTVVGARCVAGKVVQTVTLTNGETVPVSVEITSPYGVRSPSVAPGRSVTQTLTTRLPSIAAGQVGVEAEATVAGQLVSSSADVAFEAVSCR